MTRNQIEFLKYQEQKRSNMASEAEVKRSNLVREGQGQATLDETSRANRERERQGLLTLEETSRHNLAQEKQKADELLETTRANLEREAENKRSNLAREQETHRANVAHEQLGLSQLNETIRSNRASELVRNREVAERERANRASEALIHQRDSEAARANRVNEQLRERQFQHTQVIDTSRLQLEQAKHEEDVRSHKVSEGIKIGEAATKAGELAERVRSDIARETETARHNLAMELKSYQPIVTLNNSSSSQGSSSIASNTGGGGLLPGSPSQPKLPQGPSGGSGSGQTSPKLIASTIVQYPFQGISEAFNWMGGRDVRIIEERYSDGSKKYIEEVLRNGKIAQRKQISEAEVRRRTAQDAS